MTSNPATKFRPDSAILRGLAWRSTVVVVATAAVVVGLPAWARAPLFAIAALVTVHFFLRRYLRHGLMGGVLTALGFAVAVIALLGLLLNLFPFGLGRVSWALGVGIIELATLAALARWRAPDARTERRIRSVPVAAIVWTLVVAGVLAGTLIWSISSFSQTHVAPLALAAVPSRGSVVVTVSSGRDEGPYELQLVSSSGRTVLESGIHVGPDKTLSVTMTVPQHTRETVRLLRTGSKTALRTLILDTTATTTKATR